MDNNSNFKSTIKLIFVAAFFVFVIQFFEQILTILSSFWKIILPLVIGCTIAYILNLIMSKLEKHYFKKSNNQFILSSRRPVCILLSILLVIGILTLIIGLVIPKLIAAFTVTGKEIPVYFEKIKAFLLNYKEEFPTIINSIENMKIDWSELSKKVFSFTTSGIGSILSTTLSFVTFFANGIINFIISLIFAIYILASKEKLASGFHSLMDVFLNKKVAKKIKDVLIVANETFSSFIIGQCTEAVILGLLCTVYMFVLRLPYALMIGTLMGSTALIPIVGAYVGAGIGAFMILTVNPLQALIFLISITILQQLENNLIYPKVVGSSIGLPSIWVFSAVMIFGGIGGVIGMLLGVPLTATAYKLLRLVKNQRS